MDKILTLDRIAPEGLRRLPADRYEVASEFHDPTAILVRSHDMHGMEIGPGLVAVARAGAGVNNIPIARLAERGIPVFNTPGANANAVKELVVAGLLLAVRNLCDAWAYVRDLDADDPDLARRIEGGKKRFVGTEIAGRTLGVLGLGAIGVRVANAAGALGMEVLGYDPAMTVANAWRLSASVKQVASPGELFARSDAVTIHVPLTDATRGLVDRERLSRLPAGGVLLNFARGALIDEAALLEALEKGMVRRYVTDFPTGALKDHPGVTALPHLGASTSEAERNCAVMAVEELRAFLEDGTVRNAVNFPEADLPRATECRLAIANRNVPSMVGRVSTVLGNHGFNIADMLNRSRGDLGYTLFDVDCDVGATVLDEIRVIPGVVSVRVCPRATGDGSGEPSTGGTGGREGV